MPNPQRGEIWFTKMPTDPLGKGKRPVIIVSINPRNDHPRVDTVLVVPLSTSVHTGTGHPHLILEPGQTGLRERAIAKAESVSAVWKSELELPRERLRALSSSQICELARQVGLAMGCVLH
jgi:mRNA-degrading endonuclease toxin of MazEF toxin-antitoxin module